MKTLAKIFILVAAISFTACSESEATINQVLDTVDTESGTVLRTLVDFPDLVTITNEANNVINSTIEVQQGNGSFVPDFKEVNLYVQVYNDQDLIDPLLTDDGNEIGELYLQTFDASQFSISSNGLPRTDISIVVQDVADLYAAQSATPGVPSFMALRFEIVMNNGTVISNNNVGATISGGIYFNSPFLFKVIFLPI
ncbi:hypothetical protein OAP25_02940 [Flavobacteriaceae bacterium]|nr:hypothetical protein [Flavobacteriaceae bacterium]